MDLRSADQAGYGQIGQDELSHSIAGVSLLFWLEGVREDLAPAKEFAETTMPQDSCRR